MQRSMTLVLAWFGFTLIELGQTSRAIVWGQPPERSQHTFFPDPAAVTRHGPGWRFPQDGWNVVHIEGTPYERGFQHGRLLAREIVDYCETIANVRSQESPDKAWRDLRLFVCKCTVPAAIR